MKYGYFDNENKEYVINKVDVPTSWTNYIGVKDMCAVINHTAGGYLFYQTPEYHRITRFRPNGVPMDRPGHYVYIRDDDTGEYFTISWQPVGLSLDKAKYECRHGLSYTTYSVDYNGIKASQTQFIPLDDAVYLWDVSIENNGDKPRNLSIYSYCEFSFHHIDMDNKNFQMSLYATGSDYEDGVILYDLFYEETGYQFFTSNFKPQGYDCLRDSFIGRYRTESNPIAVETGRCTGSKELGGNHCGVLQKKITLQKGQSDRLVFMLGEGKKDNADKARAKYSDLAFVDKCKKDLSAFWDDKMARLQISTPSDAMNTMINIWTLYQSEINVMFSRFASFIEVGGRTGLGYRDTSQDAMTIPHSNPEKCRSRIIELLRGLTTSGYGLHLFQPEWFEPSRPKQSFKSPTIVPEPSKDDIVHGIEDVCADDALWLIASIVEFIKETGEVSLADEAVTYADGGFGTVYEHMKKILDFSAEQIGQNGICKGLRADWNDCLNLGGGESAMVSFLHHWALLHFISLAKHLGNTDDVKHYQAMADNLSKTCEAVLWDGDWYARGITSSNKKIGVHENEEGKVHMESNTWAVLSGVASFERGIKCMNSVDEYLYTPYGLMLVAPAYSKPDDEIGFVTRVYKGLKENGAIFSHPNPWAWAAECILGRGDRAMKFYDALCPYNQNENIETREAEPYSYCQFIVGRDHTAYGRARHPFMTGSGGWSYFSATRFMLGIRPDFEQLIIDPCIPSSWSEFSFTRKWRGATYNVTVTNPNGVQKGVKKILINDEETDKITIQKEGTVNEITVIMG